MIISFDLDDTLIPGTKIFETEKRNFLQKLAGVEPIRKGTIELFKTLRYQGHAIFIYTTSFRNIYKVKFYFLSYGIAVDKVINQQYHDKKLGADKNRSSKFPSAFGIDVHVDDSPGLKIEGEKFNFRTIIVEEKDLNWTKKIVESI